MGELTTKDIGTCSPAQPLTEAQARLIGHITRYIAGAGYAPTMQEMADVMGVSKVAIFEHVNHLEAKGWITRDKNKSRSIRVVGRCPSCGRMD